MAQKLELKESQAPYLSTLDTLVQSGETVILERDGRPVAVLLPIEAYRALQRHSAAPAFALDPHRQGLEQDRSAYLKLKEELLKTHRGQYVAFKDGEFVDSDLDWSTLVERMYERFGYIPIYVKKIQAQERIHRITGPRRLR